MSKLALLPVRTRTALGWWSPLLLVFAVAFLGTARSARADIAPPGTGGAANVGSGGSGSGGRGGAGGAGGGTGGAGTADGGRPTGGDKDDGGCSVTGSGSGSGLDGSIGAAMLAVGLGALLWSRRRSGARRATSSAPHPKG